MYKLKQKISLLIYIFIAINIFSSAALAQQAIEEEKITESIPTQNNNDSPQKRFLVSITPPVGYDSLRGGAIYNVIPLTLEIPVYKRVGLRLLSPLIYYESRLQTYAVAFALPVYLEKSAGQNPYHGFYAGPYVVWGGGLLPERTSRQGGGLVAGYSWAYENSMQFSLGLTRGSQGGTGLSLALGKWF